MHRFNVLHIYTPTTIVRDVFVDFVFSYNFENNPLNHFAILCIPRDYLQATDYDVCEEEEVCQVFQVTAWSDDDKDVGYQSTTVEGIITSMELTNQRSIVECILDDNFGFDGSLGLAWVTPGCRGDWNLCYCPQCE